jgi:hypothetical protein
MFSRYDQLETIQHIELVIFIKKILHIEIYPIKIFFFILFNSGKQVLVLRLRAQKKKEQKTSSFTFTEPDKRRNRYFKKNWDTQEVIPNLVKFHILSIYLFAYNMACGIGPFILLSLEFFEI